MDARYNMEEFKTERRRFVTGSPGSGKSTLERLARGSGLPTIDTDERRILSWGRKEGELPENLSLTKLLRRFPRLNWNEIDRRMDQEPNSLACGAIPPNPRDILSALWKNHFTNIEWLELPPEQVPKRLKGRKGNPFGTSDGQITTSVVYAAVMNPFMRLVSRMVPKRVRIHDATKPPEQLLSEITKGS